MLLHFREWAEKLVNLGWFVLGSCTCFPFAFAYSHVCENMSSRLEFGGLKYFEKSNAYFPFEQQKPCISVGNNFALQCWHTLLGSPNDKAAAEIAGRPGAEHEKQMRGALPFLLCLAKLSAGNTSPHCKHAIWPALEIPETTAQPVMHVLQIREALLLWSEANSSLGFIYSHLLHRKSDICLDCPARVAEDAEQLLHMRYDLLM